MTCREDKSSILSHRNSSTEAFNIAQKISQVSFLILLAKGLEEGALIKLQAVSSSRVI